MDVCPLVLTKFNLVCSHRSQVAEVAFEFMPLWPENLCLTLKQNQLCVKSCWPEHPEGIRSSLIWPGVGPYRCQDGFGGMNHREGGRRGPWHFHDSYGCCCGSWMPVWRWWRWVASRAHALVRQQKGDFLPSSDYSSSFQPDPRGLIPPLPGILGMALEEAREKDSPSFKTLALARQTLGE